MRGDSSGHDWWHVDRVRAMAVRLAGREHADPYVVELAALLHDISDYKLNGGDHERGPRLAAAWIRGLGESEAAADMIRKSRILTSVRPELRLASSSRTA